MHGRKRKKGIVGIEAAIVLIAFVIVAASLAFVALNMGLFTTQKSKEVMQRGLEESTTALEVDGSVTAYINTTASKYAIMIPIKVAPGRGAVDLNKDKITVKLVSDGKAYQNVYSGVISSVSDLSAATLANAVNGAPNASVVFVLTNDNDNVLNYGEKAVLIVTLPDLTAYQHVLVEISPPQGAPLTVDRTMPAQLPSAGVVDLG